jgi:predicted lipoprotein with Yx(FWY)xxD motif
VSRHAAAAVALLLALALAGCGGGAGSSSTTATEAAKTTPTLPKPKPPPPNAEEGTVFVSLGSAAGLGEVLVNSEGRTLYAFSGNECEGACANAWPPLLDESGEPQPSNGTAAARLGTIERPDGTQVTYADHPLYTFDGDKAPGKANGNARSAFGGTWTALKVNGEPAG